MGWAEAIKAALISIPKLLDEWKLIREYFQKVLVEMEHAREYRKVMKEFEYAKEKLLAESNTEAYMRLLRNPPRFK